MLRSVGKENLLGTQISTKFGASIKLIPLDAALVNTKDLIKDVQSAEKPDINQINFEVFQKQLKKLTQACQNQRKEKWNTLQDKNKLDNQVKVLQIQKHIQNEQNQKLRNELNEFINKTREIQNKANIQLSQYFQIKNQNTSFQIEIRNLRQSQIKNNEKLNHITTENTNLHLQINSLYAQISYWKNESKLRDTQIMLLNQQIAELMNENKRLAQIQQNKTNLSNKKFQQIFRQLQNWKIVFEKKQEQLQTKTTILQEENMMMKKTIQELSRQSMINSKINVHRSLSLSTGQHNQTTDAYHIRLFIKQKQIQKLKNTVLQLQQKIDDLQLQNAFLKKKCTQGTIFSPSGYQRYNQLQTKILKNTTINKQLKTLQTQLQIKQKQIQYLSQKLSQTNSTIQSLTIQLQKLESILKHQKILKINTQNQLNSLRNKIKRDTELFKNKIDNLQKQCENKDRIIINYVNKQKEMK